MNFQSKPILEPVKVIVVNPLGPAAQLVIVKLLSGAVLGDYQMVDLCLLVYANQLATAEELKLEIESYGDVFCFITNFANPNIIDDNPKELENHFEDLYLIIKTANNLAPNQHMTDVTAKYTSLKEVGNTSGRNIKPIIVTDGLLAMDILKSFSTNVPADIFFCPSSLTTIAKSIIGEYLNVECNNINDALVWAANDNLFHVEVEKPLIIHDAGGDGSQCDWGMISKDLLDSLNLDHTQFSSSWLKKEFISKVAASASKNPYGCIYRASEITKTLRDVWSARSGRDGMKVYSNMGVISDGSVDTLKGYPYVLPLVLSGDSFTVSKRFQNDTHLKQEIKKINIEVKKRHQLLMQYCKRILVENIINEVSTTSESGSGSAY